MGRFGIILLRKDNVLCLPRAVDRFVETLVVFFRCHRSDLPCFQMWQVGLAVLSDVTDPTWRVFRCHRSDLACFSVVTGLIWRVYHMSQVWLAAFSDVTGLTWRDFRCHRSDLPCFQLSQIWLTCFQMSLNSRGDGPCRYTEDRSEDTNISYGRLAEEDWRHALQRYRQDFLWTLHTVNTPQETLPPGLFMDFTHGQYSSRNAVARTFYGLYTRSILLKKRYHQDCLWTLHTGNTPQETLPPGLFKDFTHGQCSSWNATTRTPYGLHARAMLLEHHYH